MCPGTIAAVAGIAGGAITAGGQVLGGLSTGAQAAYMAQVARNNEEIAQQNARYAIHAGEAQAQAVSMRSAANVGKIKAAQAASGIDVNTGSAVKVRAGAQEIGKLDTETTMQQANLQAYGYRANAMSYAAQAGLESEVATEAPIAGAIGGVGSLLSSASSVGAKFVGMQPPNPSAGIGGAGQQYTAYNPPADYQGG